MYEPSIPISPFWAQMFYGGAYVVPPSKRGGTSNGVFLRKPQPIGVWCAKSGKLLPLNPPKALASSWTQPKALASSRTQPKALASSWTQLVPQSKSSTAGSKRAMDRDLKQGYKRPRGGSGPSRFKYYPEKDWRGRPM